MKTFCSEATFVVIIELSLTILVFSSSGSSSVMVAKVGDTIQLKCSSGVGCSDWEYRTPGVSDHGNGDIEICFCNEDVKNGRFHCEFSDSEAVSVLTIKNVTSDDAGIYDCKHTNATTLHSTTLIVTDDVPSCSSNVNLTEVIGSNDCSQRLSPDVVRLSCSAAFHGADARAWPLLQWRIEGQESPLNSTCVSNSTTVTCTLVLEASAHLMGKSFICSNFGEHDKCHMGPVRVLHAFNQSAVTLKTTFPEGWTVVVCEANTNSQSCSYEWKKIVTSPEGNEATKTVSHNNTMALSTPGNAGRYRCEARCSLRGHTCLIFPITINVQVDKEASPFSEPLVANLTQPTAVSTNAAKSASYLASCLSVILVIIISKDL